MTDTPDSPELRKWRDISTAPKDGTWFLGYSRRGEPTSRPYRWDQSQQFKFGTGWHPAKTFVDNPTHWMPMPAAPGGDAPDGDN